MSRWALLDCVRFCEEASSLVGTEAPREQLGASCLPQERPWSYSMGCECDRFVIETRAKAKLSEADVNGAR